MIIHISPCRLPAFSYITFSIAITEEERIFHLITNKYFRHSKQDPVSKWSLLFQKFDSQTP